MPKSKTKRPSKKAFSDPRLTERVRDALLKVPKVNERRIFGSTGFMVRGNLCISVRPTRIMCRIDPSTHKAAISRKGCRTVMMKGRKYLGWVYVDALVLETKRDLLYWVSRALAFNRSLPDATK